MIDVFVNFKLDIFSYDLDKNISFCFTKSDLVYFLTFVIPAKNY